MISESVLAGIVAEIVREGDPARVYAFGSVARGEASAGSDLDLLVVTQNGFSSAKERLDEELRLRRATRRFRVPADILLYSRDEVDRWSGSANHVIARALREGRVVYERP